VVATLPPGCSTVGVGGASYRQCGGAYYRPTYDGPNLVYVAEQP
jgi:hypothetical protein